MSFFSRHRRLTTVVLVLLGLLLAGYLQRATILSAIGRGLIQSDALVKADAIVVLAGSTPERELAAADLYLAGWAPRVVVTRVADKPDMKALIARGVKAEFEFEQRLRYLRELGVPDTALVPLRTPVETTADEADLLTRWSREHQARRLIVVTSNFHTRRAGYIFARATKGQGIEILMHPATLTPFDPNTWWHRRPVLLTGLVEWQKTVFYRLWYW
jgi:uncharacterized SAM-binding protein YcdF (DUF218 family)